MSHNKTPQEASILRIVYTASREMAEIFEEASAYASEEYDVDREVVQSRILTEFQNLMRRKNPIYRYLGIGGKGIFRSRVSGRDELAGRSLGEELYKKRFGREAEESRIEED